MNRLGLRHDNLPRTLPDLFASPNLELDAVYTHFATADDPEHPLMEEQRVRFERVRAYLDTLGVRPRLVHAANSAALLRDSRVWYDLVRPGLLLYGVVPPPLASTIPLRPALSLRSRLVAVKHIRTGETVSYGARFTAERPTRVAVVPAGYADGIDLRMAGRGVVLVRGRRAHIVGAVCMDMILLDITDIEAYPGDEVVLLGTQGDERLDVREMAAVYRHHPVGDPLPPRQPHRAHLLGGVDGLAAFERPEARTLLRERHTVLLTVAGRENVKGQCRGPRQYEVTVQGSGNRRSADPRRYLPRDRQKLAAKILNDGGRAAGAVV